MSSAVVEDGDSVEVAVRRFLSTLSYGEGDPRAWGTVYAIRLAATFDAQPANSGVARELRAVMAWLGQAPNEPADTIDVLKVRNFARRAEVLLADALGETS